MKYRHEWKHEISFGDMLELRQRLRVVMYTDPYAIDGVCRIRSLYFDDLYDRALKEKLDGVNDREKFRIRYYNGDTSFIRLEKKSKINGLCLKSGTRLTREQAALLAEGRADKLGDSDDPLVRELCRKMICRGLRPKTIVDYTREPFVYPAGNVRVTLDYDIRTGLGCTDLLDTSAVTVPAGDAPIILEVKWDEYLPDAVRAAVGLRSRLVGSFSKYAVCRIYG